MAKRSRSQKIGSRGQRFVQYLIEKSGDWIARAQEEDFGIDLEAELCEAEAKGHILKIQVKTFSAGEQPKTKCRVRRTLLEYADSCRVPVIVVAVDLKCEAASFVWLQGWLVEQRGKGQRLDEMPKNVSLPLLAKDDFPSGLGARLKTIAQHRTATQFILSLNDALQNAVATQSKEMILAVSDLLVQADKTYTDLPIHLVIEEAIQLGHSIWATNEGNRTTEIMFELCRRFGDRFTANLICRMVLRPTGYSRTGINALGLLYDNFPNHVKSLEFQKLLGHDTDPRVLYYSKLRERDLGKSIWEILSTRSDFQIDGMDLACAIRSDLPDKIANRGESAILDYLISACPPL